MLRDLAVAFPEVRACFERADAVLAGGVRPAAEPLRVPAADVRRGRRAAPEGGAHRDERGPARPGRRRAGLPRVAARPRRRARDGRGPQLRRVRRARRRRRPSPRPTCCALSEARGRFIREGAGEEAGAMAAVTAPADALEPLLAADAELVVANLNAPTQTVLSGSRAAIERALDWCKARDLSAKRLPVACAFHSPLVAPAQRRLAERLREIPISAAAHPGVLQHHGRALRRGPRGRGRPAGRASRPPRRLRRRDGGDVRGRRPAVRRGGAARRAQRAGRAHPRRPAAPVRADGPAAPPRDRPAARRARGPRRRGPARRRAPAPPRTRRPRRPRGAVAQHLDGQRRAGLAGERAATRRRRRRPRDHRRRQCPRTADPAAEDGADDPEWSSQHERPCERRARRPAAAGARRRRAPRARCARPRRGSGRRRHGALPAGHAALPGDGAQRDAGLSHGPSPGRAARRRQRLGAAAARRPGARGAPRGPGPGPARVRRAAERRAGRRRAGGPRPRPRRRGHERRREAHAGRGDRPPARDRQRPHRLPDRHARPRRRSRGRPEHRLDQARGDRRDAHGVAARRRRRRARSRGDDGQPHAARGHGRPRAAVVGHRGRTGGGTPPFR